MINYALHVAFSLQAGANPNLYYTGFSPLASAAKEGDKKFLKCLLEAKADPNAFQSVKFYVYFAMIHFLLVISSASLVAGILL